MKNLKSSFRTIYVLIFENKNLFPTLPIYKKTGALTGKYYADRFLKIVFIVLLCYKLLNPFGRNNEH